MILKLDDPKLLGDAIDIISNVVVEVRIKLLEDGLSVVAVDPANVALVIFRLPKESFSQYEVGSEVWGVNLGDLKKILKRASGAASVTLEEVEGKLKITVFDKIKRNFSLALIEVSAEDKDIPELNFGARVEMNARDFSQAVEDANVVSDSCAFVLKDDVFAVEGNGTLNSARAEFSGGDLELFGQGRSKYSLEYLMKFVKGMKISGNVVVNFSDDYPLRLDFPGEKMGIGFVLAPRVEND
ncbi:DNA polymerase sliding clamp [archaeon]|jgi:proliferating cell nuclear antigen|nr:DNA polymerase sliding clamp [archaeon]MBT7128838.1 DNA polymerase sliding clamp [archaeon]